MASRHRKQLKYQFISRSIFDFKSSNFRYSVVLYLQPRLFFWIISCNNNLKKVLGSIGRWLWTESVYKRFPSHRCHSQVLLSSLSLFNGRRLRLWRTRAFKMVVTNRLVNFSLCLPEIPL
jgi:hypothetical protein